MNRLRIALTILIIVSVVGQCSANVQAKRPNVVWISIEDSSPDFGCYGDRYAISPVVDRLAAGGVRYTRAFTHAGVCAPSRSGVITGYYPTSIATHHMRCKGVPPYPVKCFPEYLRMAGYYCTNNSKTDYQFDVPASAWDQNGAKAHWRGRNPNQPFFAVFNFTTTHESQVRQPSQQTKNLVARLKPEQRHDPAKATLPPYYPDTPIVRRDWANHYDNLTAVEIQIQEILDQLEQDGLTQDTIIWFWGDHGRGLSRGKRWLYDSGIHVPLIIQTPEAWRKQVSPGDPDALKPGTVNQELVAFVDFAPTMLALAGLPIPAHLQGQPFLGVDRSQTKPREFVFGARDRMDERYDVIRSIRDQKYKYIRNFMPLTPYSQNVSYMNEMPMMKEWRRLDREGKLTGPSALFFQATKPVEELYDTEADPHEIHNLATDPQHRSRLERMRSQLTAFMLKIEDWGLIPEAELMELERPEGEWTKTAEPRLVGAKAFASSTPAASIVFREQGEQGWKVDLSLMDLSSGKTYEVKACRIGYRDSSIVRVNQKTRPVDQAEIVASSWSDRPQKEGWLKRLHEIKSWDVLPNDQARDLYRKALANPIASARYWAVLGLRRTATPTPDLESQLSNVMQEDASPLVQMTCAQTLALWGQTDQSLTKLRQGLKHRQPEVRLAAALALDELGDKAKPAREDLKSALNDTFEYVVRVSEHALKEMESE